MTLMFCAFEGDAMILRVYGQADIIYPRDPAWADATATFPEIAGSRQVFDLTIDMVQTSCSTGVPYMDFVKSRGEEELVSFYEEMEPGGGGGEILAPQERPQHRQPGDEDLRRRLT